MEALAWAGLEVTERPQKVIAQPTHVSDSLFAKEGRYYRTWLKVVTRGKII